jgi:3-hydroxyisobutyrate dehydrogenase-like beta-hydroxyacid dehydrogenase
MAKGVRCGVVGLGTLGRPIAILMARGGFSVVAYDPRPEAGEGLGEHGVELCETNRALAERSDLICVWVQNDAQCEVAFKGDEGLLAGARAGSAIAIQSTLHPNTVKGLGAVAKAQGIDVLDAPVAGKGYLSLEDGSFSALIGGDSAVLERFRPIFEVFSNNIIHAGELGAGQMAKLSHNTMTYLSYLALQEATDLARAAGVREGVLEQIATHSGVLSPSMKTLLTIREQRLAGNDDTPAETLVRYLEVLVKDLRVAADLGAAHGLEMPGAELTATRGEQIHGIRKG